ncbi:MAG: serine hydrolase domain-containing protein [Leucobacter sp.]
MFPNLGRRARVATVGMLAIAALGLTACTGSGSGESSADVNTVSGPFAESIDVAVDSAMQLSRSSSAIVGVWTEDSGEYVRSYGDGDLDPSVQIRAAQASQPVVCALVLDLAANGSLNLDRDISKDLTRQVGIEDITYRQLCNATSGLADFKSGFGDIFANNPTRPWAERELLAQSLVHSPLSWPGLDVHVTDTNALLAARVIDVTSDQSIGDLLEDRVFKQAGMESSYYPNDGNNTLTGDAMTGYTFPKSGGDPVCDVDPVEIEELSPSMLGGAGATVTTVSDLKNFYESYLGGQFGGEEFAGLVTDTTPTKNPERDDNGDPVEEEEEAEPDHAAREWGFGIEKVGPLYGQSGAITGTMTSAYHDPESGLTVVVALNNSTAGAAFAKALAFQIASLAGENGAGAEMPWTAEVQAEALAERAICQADPEAEEE